MPVNTPIAIIGGTGKSGKYLVKYLLQKGYSLQLLLRDPAKIPSPPASIKIIQGDARDAQAVQSVIRGASTVISTLGQPKGELSIFSQATQHITVAMQAQGIRRYIVTTGLSVDIPGDNKSAWVKTATQWMKDHYPETTQDKQVEFEVLRDSGLDWTMVRLPRIEQTDALVPIVTNLADCPGEKISATSLASFLEKELRETDHYGKAPFIGNINN